MDAIISKLRGNAVTEGSHTNSPRSEVTCFLMQQVLKFYFYYLNSDKISLVRGILQMTFIWICRKSKGGRKWRNRMFTEKMFAPPPVKSVKKNVTSYSSFIDSLFADINILSSIPLIDSINRKHVLVRGMVTNFIWTLLSSF